MHEIWYGVIATAALQGLGILANHVRYGERLNNHIAADTTKKAEIDASIRENRDVLNDHEGRLSHVEGRLQAKGASAR